MIGRETHVREDVLLQVYPGGDLDEFQAARGELEHAPFGHIQHRLTGAGGVFAAEGALLDIAEELGRGGPVGEDQPAVLDPAAAGYHEGPHEDELLGVLADVDEAARAGQSGTESADVDIALPVRLGHPQDRGVQPSPS